MTTSLPNRGATGAKSRSQGDDGPVETLTLLAHVVPLGIAAAFTPTLIALQLLVVSGDRWVRRSLAVAVANAVAFSIVIGLVLAGFAKLPDAGSGSPSALDAWLRMGCGVALLAVGAYAIWPHPLLSAKMQESMERRTRHASAWVFFGLAFYFSITDFSTFVVLLPALHEVTMSSADLFARSAAVAVVVTLSLTPTWLPPTMRGLLGHRITPALDRLYGFVMRNQFRIVGAICLLFGVSLILTGVLRMPHG
jgi:hypothetical protein